MTRIRRVLACSSALAIAILFSSSVAPAGAADPASNTAASAAVAWLKTQQQSNGSFEVAGAPGFETRDAVLAIAEQAQTGATWNTAEALAAAQALKAGGSGPTPLDYLEGLMTGPIDPGAAGKTVVLTTEPLGIDATAFGSVNLLTKMGGCDGTTSATFNGILYLILAQQLLCGDTPAANITAVRNAQQANGGWGFVGDPTTDDLDNDTTAVAVEALIGSGVAITDPAVHHALEFFATNFQSNGSWQFFGADDPNSTALAILGLTAAGFDVSTSCWRDTLVPNLAGTAYTSPDAWLRSQQLTAGTDAGRIESPSDSFPPVNTFATSQSVEALLRSWLPVARGATQTCTTVGPTPTVTTTTPTAGGTMIISGDGFAPGASLTIVLHSDPVVLATATADANGAYSVAVTIPAGTTPGTHQIVVSGLGPDGQPRESVVTIEVQAAPEVLAEVVTATAGPVVTIQPAFTG